MRQQFDFLLILDALLIPVFERVFYFLKLPIAGTDDMIQHSNLRRAYFGFLISIAQANLTEVFYSESALPSPLLTLPAGLTPARAQRTSRISSPCCSPLRTTSRDWKSVV